ncbi:MAG: aspartate aminotransferase family protein [Rhodospirillales bacterium]|nr:aspartate aminotransferase family protein [Rhodospirillales bacterium]
MTLYQRDERALSKLQKLRFFPLAVTGGEGSYLTGDDGRRLLDFSASWGAVSLGHGHGAVREAVDRALADQAGASTLSAANEPAVKLAEALLDLVPGGGERRVWLGHSGSDANETVARAVVAATGRPRVISFAGAYHGGTAGSMAISAHGVQKHAERASGLHVIPYPDPYRPYGDDPTGGRIIDELEQAFRADCPPDQVAALFIEPIMSDGGLIVPPKGFMKRLTDLCRSHGILVVSDEVKVGMGRSGRFNCIEHEEVEPDIYVLGKGLGGGLPLSAAVGPASIMDFASSFSMQTLHGNPVCASAGLAVLETVAAEDLVANAARVGAALQDGLRTLAHRHPMIGDVRGRGLAIGVELVTDRASRTPDAKAAAKLVYRAFELGLVLYYVGAHSNVLEMTPPLTLIRAEADAAVSILDRALDDLAQGRVADDIAAGFEGW